MNSFQRLHTAASGEEYRRELEEIFASKRNLKEVFPYSHRQAVDRVVNATLDVLNNDESPNFVILEKLLERVVKMAGRSFGLDLVARRWFADHLVRMCEVHNVDKNRRISMLAGQEYMQAMEVFAPDFHDIWVCWITHLTGFVSRDEEKESFVSIYKVIFDVLEELAKKQRHGFDLMPYVPFEGEVITLH